VRPWRDFGAGVRRLHLFICASSPGMIGMSAAVRGSREGSMALFEWCDDYSVKIASIDAQHKKLVGMLNDLHDGMTSGSGNERLGALLEGLVTYTVQHFAYEEQLFATHGYAQARAHTEEHQRLVTQVADFKQKFESGQANVNMQLMKFLKDWLIKHILGSDKLYVAHLVERGVK
jgi:hemerythrin